MYDEENAVEDDGHGPFTSSGDLSKEGIFKNQINALRILSRKRGTAR